LNFSVGPEQEWQEDMKMCPQAIQRESQEKNKLFVDRQMREVDKKVSIAREDTGQ